MKKTDEIQNQVTDEDVIAYHLDLLKRQLNDFTRIITTALDHETLKLVDLSPDNDKDCFGKVSDLTNKISICLQMRNVLEKFSK